MGQEAHRGEGSQTTSFSQEGEIRNLIQNAIVIKDDSLILTYRKSFVKYL